MVNRIYKYSLMHLLTHSVSLLLLLQIVPWLSDIDRENIAHMLASMHLVLRQQDGGEQSTGEYGHVNNTGFEKFTER